MEIQKIRNCYLPIKHFEKTRQKFDNVKEIIIEAIINESFSVTRVIQYYVNNQKENVEISLQFPLSPKVVIKSMKAKMNGKLIISRIYEKDKAVEKYNDAISSGNVGIIGQLKAQESDIFEVNIGNLQSGEFLEIETEFLQNTQSKDLSFYYSFNLFSIPNLIEYNIKNKSSPCYFMKNNNTKENIFYVPIRFSAVVMTSSDLTRLSSPNYEISPSFLEENTKNSVVLNLSNDEIIKNKFEKVRFYFRNEGINMPHLYEQYDQKLDEYSYNFSLLHDQRSIPIPKTADFSNKVSYYDKYESNAMNDSPGVFYFLIDQSGSMSGSSINIAKKSMKLFLQSLPSGSFFDIIGFGSSFKSYFNLPLEYNTENLKKANNLIDSLSANLGGTNIFDPLAYVFKKQSTNELISYEKLAKSLFLLTDGQVENSDNVVNLIRKNIKDFRVHSIGIGTGVSIKFIRAVGKTGKGSSHLANNLDILPSLVIKALNQALMTYYTNIKLTLESENILEYPRKENISLLYQDEIFQYSFISKNKINENSYIAFSADDISDKKFINQKFKVSDILFSIPDGNEINSVIAGLELKNIDLEENTSVQISKKYQILCKYTSFFMEIENENSNELGLKKVILPVVQKQFTNNNNGLIKSSSIQTNTMSNLNYGMNRPSTAVKRNIISSKNFKKSSPITKNMKQKMDRKVASPLIKKEMKDIIKQNMVTDSQKEYKKFDASTEPSKEKSINSSKETSDPDYNMLIGSQNIEGNWSISSNSELKKVLAIYDKKIDKLKTTLIEMNLTKNFEDVLITILVIHFLLTIYQNKKDEYKLIVNKSRKYLLKNQIIYEEVATLL